MMRRTSIWLIISGLALMTLAACNGVAEAAMTAVTEAANEEVTEIVEASTEDATSTQEEASAVDTTPTGVLSEEEAAGLLYMREEEKLARDVYLTLYEQWNQPIFQNIASSEQRHMDMVLGLLTAYGLEDPAAGKGIGEFTNPDLQALYDQLVARGRQSLAEALKVGAAIEEIDILDLRERLAQTDKADIQTVYQNLMSGSENHLRAFVSTLERQTGEVYEPQYLSPEDYEAIIQAAPDHGGQGQGQGRGFGQGLGRGRGRGQGQAASP